MGGAQEGVGGPQPEAGQGWGLAAGKGFRSGIGGDPRKFLTNAAHEKFILVQKFPETMQSVFRVCIPVDVLRLLACGDFKRFCHPDTLIFSPDCP